MRLVLIIMICLFFEHANAQKLVFEIGGNATQYEYQTKNGLMADYLKAAAGLHVQLKRENVLFRFQKNKDSTGTLIKKLFIPTINYGFGFTYNQYNSVGNTQGLALSYQADHIGMLIEVGPEIPVLNSFSIDIKGIISVAKMWNGNQLIGEQYLPLDNQDQFTKIRFYSGYSVSLVHHLNKSVSGFVQFQSLSSVKEPDFPVNHLRFFPNTFSLGIKITK